MESNNGAEGKVGMWYLRRCKYYFLKVCSHTFVDYNQYTATHEALSVILTLESVAVKIYVLKGNGRGSHLERERVRKR